MVVFLDNSDTSSYLPLFIEETKDNIQQMSEKLLRLEQSPSDTEAINDIFRAIHTIKGMAATMGYTEMSNLAHEAENLLDDVRHQQAQIGPNMINGFFEVIDEFEAQLSALEKDGKPTHIGADRIRQIIDIFSLPGDASKFRLEINFSKDCLLRPARAIVTCKQLSSVCNVLETDPAQESLPGLDSLDKLTCLISTTRPDQVRSLLEDGVEIDSFVLEPQYPDHQQGAVATETQAVKNTATIRVDTEKLDQLLNLVSELVINKTSIQQAASSFPVMSDGVEHLNRLTGDLQNIVMNMRMIPLETVFNRFPRMVRDTAQALSKSVSLQIHGAETELDRTIIDDIADPLVHLLRNAVDHGIEPISERVRKGKAETGTITLKAFQTGNQVIIEVSDDGYGLDLAEIRNKARELGMSVNQDMEPSEITSLIFASGFTTSDHVTDISGRGVGLDVVKKSIESLGGTIEVLSTKGKGTTFRIALPLTLAIIQGLLVKTAEEIYVIPLSYVRETEIIYPRDIQTIGQQQIVMLRGHVLPVVFLPQLLGIGGESIPEEMSLVVVRYGEREVGILVDDLLAQQDIVIKNFNWGERFFRSFLGSTILGDGSVVFILDINALLSTVRVREGLNDA